MKYFALIVLLLFAIIGCSTDAIPKKHSKGHKQDRHLVNDISFKVSQGSYNVVIEISAGSREKWEVNKNSGKLERDSLNGKPRTIQYLGYPANYGFLPQTLLSKASGGDGDPLDAIVLGDQNQKGTIVNCKPLGVLQLLDNGEKDDKVIMAEIGSEFAKCTTLEELNQKYPNLTQSMESWFIHYKGKGEMESLGWQNQIHADKLINSAALQFLEEKTSNK